MCVSVYFTLLYSFTGVFSAGLSTISAALNSLAAVTLEDYVKPLYTKCTKQEFSSKKSTSIAKVISFLFGLLSILLAFLAQLLGGVLQVSRKNTHITSFQIIRYVYKYNINLTLKSLFVVQFLLS